MMTRRGTRLFIPVSFLFNGDYDDSDDIMDDVANSQFGSSSNWLGQTLECYRYQSRDLPISPAVTFGFPWIKVILEMPTAVA